MHQLTSTADGSSRSTTESGRVPTGRVLNRTESQLASYMDDERSACAIAPFVYLCEGCTEAEVEEAVIMTLVSALEEVHGTVVVEYCCGERRDLLRSAALQETTSRLTS